MPPTAFDVVASPPYSDDEIRRRIDACPKLASLQSIAATLNRLANAEEHVTSDIANVVRRDPALTARLLRIVNSVYYGLSAKLTSIEEAVFFLGIRRVRELALATPVIEELERFRSPTSPIPLRLWQEIWMHSVGTAFVCREILDGSPAPIDDDSSYLVGLLHNVGKIVMAYTFPEEFIATTNSPRATAADVCALERELIGWDHAQIGAYFLERHKVAEEIVFAVRYHTDPARAPVHHFFAAAVEVADHLTRYAGVGSSFEKIPAIAPNGWNELAGWKILCATEGIESRLARPSLSGMLETLPGTLKELL